MLAGVTGCAGSGQSTVAGLLYSLGASVCSLDEVGHRLLDRKPVALRLSEVLGLPSIRDMGSPGIRSVLRDRAFAEPEFMGKLCSVLHPRMARWAALSARALRGRPGLYVLEGALLFELGISSLLDTTIVVAAERETCARRLAERDGLGADDAESRIAMQMPLTEKAAKADWIVWNGAGTTPGSLGKQVEGLHRQLAGWRNDGSPHS
jgi:dephospho-CoA kinase